MTPAAIRCSHCRRLAAIALFLCAGAPLDGSPPERRTAQEDQVRAAFLFQLAQFVNWPEDGRGTAQTPLRFCVLGDDTMAGSLSPTVRGKTIQGRPIEVQQLASPERLPQCHLAFIGYKRQKELQAFLTAWAYPAVLLVGESDRFAELGGMVNLVIASGKVSFEINLSSVHRARLEMRSQLLRFATLVGDGKEAPR